MPTLNHKAALGQSYLSDSGNNIQSFTTKVTKSTKKIKQKAYLSDHPRPHAAFDFIRVNSRPFAVRF